jgi:S-adenosylmethionine uptake transporter
MTRWQPYLPFLAAVTGIALYCFMDAAMKRASLTGGVYNALLFRSLIGTGLLLPLWRIGGGSWPAAAALRLHGTRSVVVAGMALLYFWGLVRLPLAEAIAISFIAPLIALYLAAVILGEQITRWAIAGSLLGLAGVVVISAGHLGQGGGTAQGPGIAAVLCSAVLYGWNLILQRQQAQLARPREVAFFQNLMIALILLLAAPWLAQRPSLPGLGLIAASAVLAAASLMLLSWAYARSEAQLLLPTEYSAFVWAALAGWLWFGERLDTATLMGGALIVAGCLTAARGTPSQHVELTVA